MTFGLAMELESLEDVLEGEIAVLLVEVGAELENAAGGEIAVQAAVLNVVSGK